MTPAPRIQVELHKHLWEECCSGIGLAPVTVRFRRFPSSQQRKGAFKAVWGEAQRHPPMIYVYLCKDGMDTDRLRDAQRELTFTLMHELRHIWQFTNWTEEKWAADQLLPYHYKECEKDANDWADAHRASWYDVCTLRRSYRSNLTRLSETERRVLG